MHKSISEIILSHSKSFGERKAVVAGNTSINYASFVKKSLQVAGYLKNGGVKNEDPVCLYFGRNIDYIISLFGVLLSGGCFVPILPSYPVERVNSIIEDTNTKIILTNRFDTFNNEKYKSKLTFLEDIFLKNSFKGYSYEVFPENLCYILFTSGSTGKPKGVLIEHHSLLNLITAFEKIAPSKEYPVTTSVCPFGFDVSIWEIFSTLYFGGTLHILEPEKIINPKYLSDYLISAGITSSYIPPGMLETLADEFEKESRAISLNRMLVGVEPIKQKALERFVNRIPGVKIINGYGPTEATICSTFYNFENTCEPEEITPIGKPVENYEVCLVDNKLNEVKDGEPGELLISGEGLARGYLNLPEHTSEKFVTIINKDNKRFYKSGDIVKRLPDGNFKFIGRIDNQVKYRGYRIELEEIETVIGRFPGISDVSVILKKLSDENILMVCYYSSVGLIDEIELSEFISLYLPEYMLPSLFIKKESLPRNDAGKIDKLYLSKLDVVTNNINENDLYNLENELILLWQDVLNIKEVHLKDNFFELGGASLSAVKIISRIFKLTGIEVSFNYFFSHPFINDLAELIRGKSKSKINKKVDYLSITNRKDKLLVSPAQSRMYLIEQFSKGSGLFNIPLLFKIKGGIEVDKLNKSINILIKKNQILRTHIINHDGNVLQKIVSDLNFEIFETNISDLEADDKSKFISDLSEKEDKYYFIIENLPLFRIHLVKTDFEEYYLLINIHHLISDNWSVGLFLEEISKIYNSLLENKKVDSAENEYQYQDFTNFHLNWLKTDECRKQMEYWENKLNGVEHILNLQTDNQRKKYQTFNGDELAFFFNENLTAEIKKYCLCNNISLFMFLLGCFGILLSKYSGQKDFLIGTPIANRIDERFEKIMGMMINNLAIRVNLSGNPNMEDYFNQIKTNLLEAYDNQILPFEKLIDVIKVNRDTSRSLLIQVMFNFLDEHREKLKLKGTQIKYEDIRKRKSHLDVTFSAYFFANEIKLYLEYNTDLFFESRIKRLIINFTEIVIQIISRNNLFYSDINILSESEKQEIIYSWNSNYLEIGDLCTPGLIKSVCEKYGNKTALKFNESELSYNDLDRISDIIASNICCFTKGKKAKIGLYLERNENIILNILGVWKAGCCYIPLDTEYPEERINYIISESKPDVLITSEKNKNKFKNIADVVLTTSEVLSPSESFVLPKTEYSDLAYIIYTSGSTGKPKGVEITHEALINFVKSITEKIDVTENDVLLSVTTFSFDISLLEFIIPLSRGGKLILASRDEARDGYLLNELMIKNGVTTFQATPATYKILLETGWQGGDSIKILCGGEAFQKDLAATLFNKCTSLWNMYGPTETTIWSAIKKISKDDFVDNAPQNVSIGKPINNTYIYILDEFLNPLPVGVQGQIAIGGKGVSQGYHNDIKLTKKKFIKNTFITGEEKMFLTGDVGYFDESGNIHFVGRNDNQVKIRGFRIDLGEIEEALNQVKGIKDKVVTSFNDNTNNASLALYIILSDGESLSDMDVKLYLKDKLPEYMVPPYIIFLKEFPLTPNGKVDKKNLPIPDSNSDVSNDKLIQPRSITEFEVLSIWEKILNTENIGTNSNFFDSGGNSLLAVKLISDIEKKTGVRLPLAVLFESSTVELLSKFIEKTKLISWKSLVPIKVSGNKKPLYIIHGAGLNLLLFKTLANLMDENQPVYGLQAKGLNGVDEPLKTVQEMASHYISEIEESDNSGEYSIAGYSLGGVLAFEMAKQWIKAGKKISFLGMFDAVAYSSNVGLTKYKRFLKSTNLLVKQILFGISHFIVIPNNKKKDYLKRKWQGIERKFGKKQYFEYEKNVDIGLNAEESKEIPEYLKKVMDSTYLAFEKYKLEPVNVKVTLFRASEKTYYIKDFDKYGWCEYALSGVEVNEIQGDHNKLFAPPNDVLFANTLQKNLNNSNQT